MATLWTLGCDAADPPSLARFWALALGYVIEPGFDEPDNTSIIDPDGVGPAIGFLKVPEPKTSKNRMHIDLRLAGEPPWDSAERETPDPREGRGAGGRPARPRCVRSSYGDEFGHVVMLDLEGNEFCVA